MFMTTDQEYVIATYLVHGNLNFHKKAQEIAVDCGTWTDLLNPAFPTASAGIHPGLTPALYSDLGKNFIVNAWGGILGHPQGTTAGVIAFTDAIQAVVSGRSLKEAAEDSPALRSALKKWGA